MTKLAILSLIALVCIITIPTAFAQEQIINSYPSKFLCGALPNFTFEDPLTPGEYATVVDVHNPHTLPVEFEWKAVLDDDKISQFQNQTLAPNAATKIDCKDIRDTLNQSPNNFIVGFVVIRHLPIMNPISNEEINLDVVSAYTYFAKDIGVSLEIEKIDSKNVTASDSILSGTSSGSSPTSGTGPVSTGFFNDNISDIPFPSPDENDFTLVNQTPISHRTFLIIFEDSTTVIEGNTILQSLNARIIGAISDFNLIYVKLPDMPLTQTFTILDQLEQNNKITAAVMDFGGLKPQSLPPQNIQPSLWTWEKVLQIGPAPPPISGNWGLKIIRAPQMWHLDDYVNTNNLQNKICVGQIEGGTGIQTTHPDLNNKFDNGTSSTISTEHATKVAGVIAADWSNKEGVEGVNPWIDKIFYRNERISQGVILSLPGGDTITQHLNALNIILKDDCIRVINYSFGGVTRGLSPFQQRMVDKAGEAFDDAMDEWKTKHSSREVIFVTVAGDSGPTGLARYSNPIANAAIRNLGPYIAVEAINNLNNAWVSTSLQGSVSAPGKCIRTTEVDDTNNGDDFDCTWSDSGRSASDKKYATVTGVSFAAAYVSGLASALMTLDGTLTADQIKTLLVTSPYTVQTSGGTQPHIDAFAASMGIDFFTGNNNLQRGLVDVNDDTLDGNARQDKDDDQIPNENYDEDVWLPSPRTLARGDGAINMRDFRVLRDAMLETLLLENILTPSSVSLTGASNHYLRDLNWDGCLNGSVVSVYGPVSSSTPGCNSVGLIPEPEENVYPRYDFNGDGIIHPEGRKHSTNEGAAPFKLASPNFDCSGGPNIPLSCYRDIDVLIDYRVWDDDNIENNKNDFDGKRWDTGPDPNTDTCADSSSMKWQPSHYMLQEFGIIAGGGPVGGHPDNVIDYFYSADFHFIVGPDANPYNNATVFVYSEIPASDGIDNDGNGVTDEDFERFWFKCFVFNGTITKKNLVLTVPLYNDPQENKVKVQFVGFETINDEKVYENTKLGDDCTIRHDNVLDKDNWLVSGCVSGP